MDKEQVVNIARSYKDALTSAGWNDASVYLYGSYSKGTARKDSDIDLAVVVPQMHGNWFTDVPFLWKIGRKINDLIEPVLIEKSHPSPLYDEVLRTGISIG